MAAFAFGSLVAFGREAERLGRPSIDVGGFLVPGPESHPSTSPGNEVQHHELADGQGEEAGSAAGSRSGSRRPQAEAASRAAAHALGALRATWHGQGITGAEFEELAVYYPDVRVSADSSFSIFLSLSAGLFADLPFRARLVLEVPRPEFSAPARPFAYIHEPAAPAAPDSRRWRPASFKVPRPPSMVPAVRVWARWVGGVAHGQPIISHHKYPDLSICACMPHQWIRGVHALVDYVGMCVAWIGKALHEQELGFYPGPQHVREWVRVERDRRAEFCGCGAPRRYAACHRPSDRKISRERLRELQQQTHWQHFRELSDQARRSAPPVSVWCPL